MKKNHSHLSEKERAVIAIRDRQGSCVRAIAGPPEGRASFRVESVMATYTLE